MRSFAPTVFLSAFLLFLVQPVLGKYILPWFGSTPSVWTTCLLFFQTMLLAGYAYAHLIVSRLSPKRQAFTQLLLVGLTITLLPITPTEAWIPKADQNPTLHILLLLLNSVGGPFFILASSGPLLQAWFAQTHPGRSPYRLYALSNIGSFLALIAYPLVIERYLKLNIQTVGWSAAWTIYAALVAVCAYHFITASKTSTATGSNQPDPATKSPRPARGIIALWIALAACGSGLLMATTNRLCLDVAVFPFLWILPLGIYLLTFVICFESDRWYSRPVFSALLPIALACACYSILGGADLSILVQICAGAIVLFLSCMSCHGELARLRPHTQHLTLFYLAISAGGAIGGLFVAVIAPALLNDVWEFHILLALTYLLVMLTIVRSMATASQPSRSIYSRTGSFAAWAGFVVLSGVVITVYLEPASWPIYSLEYPPDESLVSLLANSGVAIAATPIVVAGCILAKRSWRTHARSHWRSGPFIARYLLLTAAVAVLIPSVCVLGYDVLKQREDVVAQERNFYGVLRVREFEKGKNAHDLTLYHGRIQHGYQLQNEAYRGWPTAYFGPTSGIGLAIRNHPHRSTEGRQFRLGVVGLGVGTIAAYANTNIIQEAEGELLAVSNNRSPGDHIAFYEIDPQIDAWSKEYFTYRADAIERGAEVTSFIGDARMLMQQQIQRDVHQAYDILVIDAFSGDAIPVHLLTQECFQTYFAHMATDGVLAINVTNRYLTLAPIVRRIADRHDYTAVYIHTPADLNDDINASDWVIISNNEEFMERDEILERCNEWPMVGPLWSDDYSSLFAAFR
jgi:hypothetical protein